MSVVDTVTTAIGNFSNLWYSTNDDFLTKLGNEEILQIGNSLSSLFSGEDSKKFKIDMPNLIVVGSQSSGKSSLINRIIGMDILPTGSNMVTRAPLHLQLNKSTHSRAEFGYYENGNWVSEKIIDITIVANLPQPTNFEIKAIRNEIENITIKKAGSLKNITTNEIILKILSPNIPDISLTDLPGLTTISLTDKGQPANIAEQIRNLVGHYIANPRTIILVVMPARTDLETDMALHLVKKHDPHGERSCGILTKVDLMNVDTDISDYLKNNISKALQLKYGYYAVKNRNTKESLTINIQDYRKYENDYFSTHSVYKKIDSQNRLGIECIRINLSKILIKHLKENIPDIIREINKKENNVSNLLKLLGPKMPSDKDSKYSLLNELLSNFCRNYIKALQEKCGLNYGLKIKDNFINYRNIIENTIPLFTDETIQQTITNSSGNHMDFSVFSIEILEKCLNKEKPMELLKKPSYDLVKNIAILLNNLTEILLNEPKMERFPKLIQEIKINILQKTNKYQEIMYQLIDNLINIEENYIWTENNTFLTELKLLFKKSFESDNIKIINKLLIEYFQTVKSTFKDQLPKMIMFFMITDIENTIHSKLFELLTSEDNISLYLQEPNDVHSKRLNLENNQNKLIKAKESLLNTLSH